MILKNITKQDEGRGCDFVLAGVHYSGVIRMVTSTACIVGYAGTTGYKLRTVPSTDFDKLNVWDRGTVFQVLEGPAPKSL